MKSYKISLKDVFSDDPNSPFWVNLKASPGFTKFEEDLAEIMEESLKHGVPYVQIPKDKSERK